MSAELVSALLGASDARLRMALTEAFSRIATFCPAQRITLLAGDGSVLAHWPPDAPEPDASERAALVALAQDDLATPPHRVVLTLHGDGEPLGLLALDHPEPACSTFSRVLLGSLAPVLSNTLMRLLALRHREMLETELASAEAALGTATAETELTRRRLADFAAVSDEWFWEQDADLRYIETAPFPAPLSPFGSGQAGLTREELASRWGCDTNTPAWHRLRRRLEAREPFERFVYTVRDASGAEQWLTVSGKPVFDVKGRFTGYRGTCALITDRMRRETDARATAQRFEATLNALPYLMIEADHEARYTRIYADAGHMAPMHGPHCLGRSFEQVLPPEVACVFMQAMEAVDRTGRAEGLRYRTAVDAASEWFEISASRRMNTSAEEPAGYVFLVRDVTEDQRRKDRLRMLGKIVELMTNLVAVVDNDHRVMWVNPAFEAHTGHRLDDIRGKLLADLTRSAETDPETVRQISGAIARCEPCRTEILNVDKEGRPYWIDLNIHPLRDETDQMLGFVSVETVITEQKRNAAAMEDLARAATAARQRLENALEALPDGVAIFDDSDRLVVANGVFRAMRPGLSEMLADPEPPGVVADAPALPDARGRVLREVRLADGRWLRLMNMRTSDGGRICLEFDISPRRAQIAALDAANLDLTRALAERNAAEQRLAGIIEAAEVGIWEYDFSRNLIEIKGFWKETLGYGTGDVERLTIGEFLKMVHPEDRAAVVAVRTRIEQADTAFMSLETRLRHRDGHWVSVLSRGRVTHRNAAGDPEIVSGVHLDISERKALEQKIAAGRNFLYNALENSIAAIAVLDADGTFVFANHEAERILRTSLPEIVGRRYCGPEWQLLATDGTPLADEDVPYRQALSTGIAVRNLRHAVVLPDGARRILSVNAVPLVADGQAPQVVCSFTDITEQVDTLNRTREGLARAEEASRAKSLFLANMSHEIRTPLNGVLGMAELLEATLSGPRQKLMIRTIRNSGETLLSILNNILDMSKIEAGKLGLEAVPFNPADLVRQVETVYALKAQEKGLEFEVLTGMGCDKGRLGDPHRILQILHNLLSNAVKFTDAGRITMVLTARASQRLVIEIADTGIGMTPEQSARVFDSFDQADGSVTRRFGGTGLGMSIVKQLVTLMGGEIAVSSRIAEGTTVRVVLPLPLADLPQAEVAALSAGEGACFEGRHLLIADDSATNRLVLKEMLAETRARLTLVEDGQQALEACRAGGYDLLLLDISMPVMDGLTALKQIRRAEAEGGQTPVPAVAVTANAMAHQVSDYIDGGFDAHVAKPFRRQELLRTLAALLTRS